MRSTRTSGVLAALLVAGVFAEAGRAAAAQESKRASAETKEPPVRLSNTANGMGLRLQLRIATAPTQASPRPADVL